MKICSRCKQPKPFDLFNKKRKAYSSYCKECNKENNKVWYKLNKEKHKIKTRLVNQKLKTRNKQFILDFLKGKSCVDCGYTNIHAFQFDHIKGKFKAISAMVLESYSIEAIKEEIAKCEIVCANCHQIRTKNRRLGPSVN